MFQRLGILLLVVLIGTSVSLAKTPEKQRAETLRDLPGVSFVVEDLYADVEADGLSAARLRNDVEFALRRAGIRLLTESEWSATPGRPFLYIRVSTVKVGGRYAFHLSMELFQHVRLERYRDIAPVQAPTWEAKEEIGVIEAAQVRDIGSYVTDQLEEFIRAFREVNTV